MSAKQSGIPENQQPLFEGLRFDPREHSLTPFVPWTEYGDAKKVAVVTSPEKGAYVDIQERDTALLATLGYLAHASMMIGLQRVAESDPNSPIRKKIEQRYKNETPSVLGNAPAVQLENELAARSDFRDAYGYEPLVKLTRDPVQVSSDFAEEFDSFQDMYYGSKGNKNRKHFEKQIKKNQRISENMPLIRRAIRRSMHQDPVE